MTLKNAKEIFLEYEGDSYFRRNYDALNGDKINPDVLFYSEFLQKKGYINSDTKIVEIGAANGRNLIHFKNKFGLNVSGVEPSTEAVNYGNEMFFDGKEVLIKGTSDSLPYEDESIDIVLFGFSLFWVDRKYLCRSISEADRVLREGGYLFITDFDTPIPYKRVIVHNKDAFTYKMNYSRLFLSNPQYFLVEKKNYSHSGDVFDQSIQERVSAQILYKEYVDNAYIFD